MTAHNYLTAVKRRTMTDMLWHLEPLPPGYGLRGFVPVDSRGEDCYGRRWPGAGQDNTVQEGLLNIPSDAGRALRVLFDATGMEDGDAGRTSMLLVAVKDGDVLQRSDSAAVVTAARVTGTVHLASAVALHGGGTGLAGLNLAGMLLDEAELDGASLRGANLQFASLDLARLADADLRDAFGEGAHLGWAAAPRADLRKARFAGADFRHADLRAADLRGADLADADLAGARLDGANLAYACLAGASLQDAHLEGAYLHGCAVGGARVHGARVTGSQANRDWLDGEDAQGDVSWQAEGDPL